MAVQAVVGGVGLRCGALLLAWSVLGSAQQSAAEFPSAVAAPPPASTPPSSTVPSTAPVAAPPAVTPVETRVPPRASPTVPEPLPSWGIGAGVFGAGDSLLSTPVNPTFAGALERRVARHTWLALNATGSYESRDVPLSSSSASPDPAKVAVRTLGGALLLGVRHEVAHGVVDVAIFSAAFIAAQRLRHDTFLVSENSGGFPYNPSNTRSFGLMGGLTVERRLIQDLAVRLSLEFARLSFSRTQTETLDRLGVGTPVDLKSRSFSVSLKPGLLLYFYF